MFSASHELKDYPGDCARVHGHNWGVSAIVGVPDIDELGMGVDFRTLRECLEKIILELDHSHLNDFAAFRDVNPTAESIAKYLYQRMKSELPAGIDLVEVRVEETEHDWASYSEP
jgi:6-pyruvoyltetrahydropterin/6-carboxytetrahydropterin synthase